MVSIPGRTILYWIVLLASAVSITAGDRLRIPFEVFPEKLNLTDVPCSQAIYVAQHSPVYFQPNTNVDECQRYFLGSKRFECTVGIVCDRDTGLLDPNLGSGISPYFFLYDGTIGMSLLTGNAFDGVPRYARNGGADLYVISGWLKLEAICAAFCLEDLTDVHYEIGIIKQAKPLDAGKEKPIFVESDTCKCGLKTRQREGILDDNILFAVEFPWMAVFAQPGLDQTTACTGALISNRHIVTAAHCNVKIGDIVSLLHVRRKDAPTYFGYYGLPADPNKLVKIDTDKIDGTYDYDEGTDASVGNVTVHPLYSTSGADSPSWDLAVITLTEKLNINSDEYTPICLPPIGDNLLYEEEIPMLLVGFGLANPGVLAQRLHLEKLSLNLYDCEKIKYPFSKGICTGKIGSPTSFVGEAGGPLMYPAKWDQYVLAGVASSGQINGVEVYAKHDNSWGMLQKDKRTPLIHIYADIREHSQWIHLVMASYDSATCMSP